MSKELQMLVHTTGRQNAGVTPQIRQSIYGENRQVTFHVRPLQTEELSSILCRSEMKLVLEIPMYFDLNKYLFIRTSLIARIVEIINNQNDCETCNHGVSSKHVTLGLLQLHFEIEMRLYGHKINICLYLIQFSLFNNAMIFFWFP